ncbi:hypothetical protein JCM10207_002994 [Rhodosporidiobolus poonsookiae]
MSSNVLPAPTADPAAASAPPQPRQPASWASLPAELKERIVALVAADPEKGRASLPRSVAQLCSVNRELRDLARPFLWKFVELDGRSSEQLLLFFRDISPEVASFIRKLRWDHVSIIDKDRSSLSQATIDGAEVAAGLSSSHLASDSFRCRRVPGLLIGEIIKQCTELKQVNFIAIHPEYFGLADNFVDHAFEALVSHAAPKLRTVEFIVGWNSRIGMQLLPRLLEAATELEGVQIGVVARMPWQPADAPGYGAVWAALSKLKKLEGLMTTLPLPSAEELAATPLTGPLTHVQLDALDIPSPPALAALLRPVTSTLESLSLNYSEAKGRAILSFDLSALLRPTPPSYDFPPLTFPKLAHLAVRDAPALLPVFTPPPSASSSSLRALAFENLTIRHLTPLLALVEAHKSTLKAIQFRVSNPDDPTAGYFEVFAELSEWAEKNGVELDLDMDDDGSGDEDFEEDDL